MKWNILALLMGLSVSAFSQQSIVWSEDFSNGIPSSWINQEAGGIASWEYRGPSTTPDIAVGTQSNCAMGGATNPDVIESETVDNGFVIFDGSYWDNPDLPCNLDGFGTGAAPGPHIATLTVSSINLTGVMYPALEFQHYYRNYQSATRVEMSIAGGEWNVIYQSTEALGQFTERDLKTRIILGSDASNQSDVRFRFVFDGLYYYWMIDDIKVINLFENDIVIDSGSYGDFDFFAPEHPTGYEEMEYTKYPQELAPLLKFNVMATNNGWFTQTGVKLRATVENVNTNEILTQQLSTEEFNLQPLGSIELRAGMFQMPNEIGFYRVRYEVTQDAEDADNANDLLELYFEITEDVYARDHDNVEAVLLPIENSELTPFEVGSIYHIPIADQAAYSLSVALGPGTSTPTSLYAKLYRAEFNFDLSLTEVGSTGLVPVTATQINDFGGNQFITLAFDNPISLLEGKAYLAVIGSPSGMINLYVGLSDTAELNTAWLRLLPNTGGVQSFALERTPMIRLNLGNDIIGIEKSYEADNDVTVFPNPADEILKINSVGAIQLLAITDAMGRNVLSLSSTHAHSHELDLNQLSPGAYFISVRTKKGISVIRFLKK